MLGLHKPAPCPLGVLKQADHLVYNAGHEGHHVLLLLLGAASIFCTRVLPSPGRSATIYCLYWCVQYGRTVCIVFYCIICC
jgi:hypothetical protein